MKQTTSYSWDIRKGGVVNYLLWVWTANVGLLVLLLILMGYVAIYYNDRAIHAQQATEASQLMMAIRQKVLDAAALKGADFALEQELNQNPEIAHSIDDAFENDALLVYITFITPDGNSHIFKRPNTQDNYSLRTPDVMAGDPDSPVPDDEQLAEQLLQQHALPIVNHDRHLGSIQFSLSDDGVRQEISASRQPVMQAFIIAGSISLLVLAVGGFTVWRLLNHIRAMDEVAARQKYVSDIYRISRRMVHEIRNPLNAIRMQAAVVRNKIRRPDESNLEIAFNQLDQLEKETLRLEKMTRSYLDLGHPPAREMANIHLGSFIEELMTFLEPEFEHLPIDIEYTRGPTAEMLYTRMDTTQLRSVVLNLIKNAREAIVGEGRIVVHLAEGEHGRAIIFVQDTGHGISEADLKHIFEPDFTRKYDGTGLGLAIAHQIMNNVGGKITVQSQVDKGTCFYVRLPRAGAPAPSDAVPEGQPLSATG